MVMMLIGFAGGLAVLAELRRRRPPAASSPTRATYHAMNLGGRVAVVAAGLPADAWPSVAVNVTWALISAHGLARAYGARSTYWAQMPSPE